MAAARKQALFFLGSEIHIWRANIPDGCVIFVYPYCRKHSVSQSLSIVRNLISIWETFHDHFLSHSTGRLISDQVKVLVNMSLQVLISRLSPLIGKKRFSGSSIFLPVRIQEIFRLLLFPIPRITLL